MGKTGPSFKFCVVGNRDAMLNMTHKKFIPGPAKYKLPDTSNYAPSCRLAIFLKNTKILI